MSALKRKRSGQFLSSRKSLCVDKIKQFGRKDQKCVQVTDSLISDSINNPDMTDCPKVNDNNTWLNGRRIVEIGHLASQLYCTDCGLALQLANITKETRYGFGSLFYINCSCGVINSVETNKRHRVNKQGPKVFDINTKAALGKRKINILICDISHFPPDK
jgi:hypothetical protein